MTLPDRIAAMSIALADRSEDVESRVAAYVLAAREVLRTLSLPTILTELLGAEGAEWALEQTTGRLHLGFLAPPGTELPHLASAAAAAGFTHQPEIYQSEIMARELAWRLGQDSLPTTIFKARLPDGSRAGIEAFLPSVVPVTGTSWVLQGAGTHIGLGLRLPEAVDEALRLAQVQGFRTPAFLHGVPASNLGHAIRVVYLEGPLQGGPMRWEFYHSGEESEEQ